MVHSPTTCATEPMHALVICALVVGLAGVAESGCSRQTDIAAHSQVAQQRLAPANFRSNNSDSGLAAMATVWTTHKQPGYHELPSEGLLTSSFLRWIRQETRILQRSPTQWYELSTRSVWAPQAKTYLSQHFYPTIWQLALLQSLTAEGQKQDPETHLSQHFYSTIRQLVLLQSPTAEGQEQDTETHLSQHFYPTIWQLALLQSHTTKGQEQVPVIRYTPVPADGPFLATIILLGAVVSAAPLRKIKHLLHRVCCCPKACPLDTSLTALLKRNIYRMRANRRMRARNCSLMQSLLLAVIGKSFPRLHRCPSSIARAALRQQQQGLSSKPTTREDNRRARQVQSELNMNLLHEVASSSSVGHRRVTYSLLDRGQPHPACRHPHALSLKKACTASHCKHSAGEHLSPAVQSMRGCMAMIQTY